MSSRIDHPLPLTSFRAKGEMIEIRFQDLRFSLEETAEFLYMMMGKKLEDSIVALMGKKNRRVGPDYCALSLRHF
jgi:ATP/maltotriose-dependent transcriptional regulator MalT